jgi:hypothetical protein
VAVEGTNGALWVKHGTGSWTNLGGGLSAAPAVALLPGGADLYVVTGTNHTLWERTDSTGWRQLSSFACLDNPAATISGTTLTVACQASNHATYLAQTTVSGNLLPTTLSAFSSLGGTTTYGPAVSVVNGTLTYFVLGTDGRVWWRTLSQGWAPLSGVTCSGHPAASTAGTSSYLVCDGGTSGVWYTKNTGSGWSSWKSLSGSFTDGPGVVASSSGAVIVAEGGSNVVYQNQLSSSGTASGWQSTGGTALHGAAAG